MMDKDLLLVSTKCSFNRQNQAKYDTTDGKDDKQIDAVVIDDDNSIVYIVQGKL